MEITKCDVCNIELPKKSRWFFSIEPEPFLRLHLYKYPEEFQLCKKCYLNLVKFLKSTSNKHKVTK